jgi:hypothetical protein
MDISGQSRWIICGRADSGRSRHFLRLPAVPALLFLLPTVAVLVVALLGSPSVASAQESGAIQGTVTDARTGAPSRRRMGPSGSPT